MHHEKSALCDRYIVEFIHDATKNYYEGGTYACRNCNNIKFPLYVLKILKLCLFCLPMLVPVTVRCPSNGRSAYSTSGLLAPAAQSSAGCATCSYLPWTAVLPRRPHRPHTTPTAGQAIPTLHSPTPPVILRRRQRSRTSEPSYSSPRGHPLPRLPRLRVVPFLGLAVVHRRGQCG